MLYDATVLLATYNGENFLDEQLKSIASQVGVKVSVYVVDAGSSDQTISILQKWFNRGLKLSYRISEGSNPSTSFMALLQERRNDCFIFFADQDDVWSHDKCFNMIQKHFQTKSEVIICERIIIDENGMVRDNQTSRKLVPSWNNALIENIAFGNCTLLTSRFANFVLETTPPDNFLYDSWIYLLASLQKNISSVNSKQVNYRIHSGNAIGISGKFALLRKYRGWIRFANQVLSIEAKYLNKLTENERLSFISYRDSFEIYSFRNLAKVTFRNPAMRQNKFESLIHRFTFPILVMLFWINED